MKVNENSDLKYIWQTELFEFEMLLFHQHFRFNQLLDEKSS